MSWMQWHIFNWPLHSCFVVLLRLQKALLSIVLKGCEPFTELEECFIAHTPPAKAVKSLLLARAGPVMQEMRGREWEKDKGRCKREAKKEAGRGIEHQFSFLIAYPLSSLFLINSHRSAYREQIYVRCVIYEISVELAGHHGSATPGAEGEDCRAGGQFPGGEEQAGRRGIQVGWQRKWHHRFGQANVHDHDGDDRLHQVSSNCPLPCSNACQRPHIHLSFRFNSIDLSGHALLLRFHCVPAQCFSFILVCMAVCIGNEMCTSLFRGKSFPILKERLVKSVIFFT